MLAFQKENKYFCFIYPVDTIMNHEGLGNVTWGSWWNYWQFKCSSSVLVLFLMRKHELSKSFWLIRCSSVVEYYIMWRPWVLIPALQYKTTQILTMPTHKRTLFSIKIKTSILIGDAYMKTASLLRMVQHTSNPSYSGDWGRGISSGYIVKPPIKRSNKIKLPAT